MFKLNKAPENVQDAADRYLFLLQSTNAVMVCGNYSLKRALIEFANKYGNVMLKDPKGLKTALEMFFDIKGNVSLHNERCFCVTNFFSWMQEEGYIEQDPSRIYTHVS